MQEHWGFSDAFDRQRMDPAAGESPRPHTPEWELYWQKYGYPQLRDALRAFWGPDGIGNEQCQCGSVPPRQHPRPEWTFGPPSLAEQILASYQAPEPVAGWDASGDRGLSDGACRVSLGDRQNLIVETRDPHDSELCCMASIPLKALRSLYATIGLVLREQEHR
jgi:hypothetical protein